ncbi:MAG: transglutaminase domain-containing protein [Oscillospiraceae bacterium]
MKKRDFFKRLCSAFLALGTAFTVIGFNVGAAATLSDAKNGLPLFYDSLTTDEKVIYVRLRQGVMNNEEKINTYVIKNADSYNRICELILYNDDLAFNLCGISASTTGSCSTFTPTYDIDNFTYSLMVDEMQKAAEKIAVKARKIKDEYSRIEYIHDTIAENTEYFAVDDPEAYVGYTHYAYGALVEGRAVCQGYSAAFAYVCRMSGIQCITVYGTSRGESHSWNKVLCDGKWYNVDLTWDDPVSNFKDNVNHNYFMLSDPEFAKDHTVKNITGTSQPAEESRPYFIEHGLNAGDNSSAAKTLETLLTEQAEKGGKTATISLKDDRVFKNFVNYLEYKDRTRMKTLLKNVKKASKADINTTATWYIADPERRTVTVVLVYNDAKLSDYFNVPELIAEENLDTYKKMGIKIDIPEKTEEKAVVK